MRKEEERDGILEQIDKRIARIENSGHDIVYDGAQL